MYAADFMVRAVSTMADVLTVMSVELQAGAHEKSQVLGKSPEGAVNGQHAEVNTSCSVSFKF